MLTKSKVASKSTTSKINLNGDKSNEWIAECAYYKAEKRNFEPGYEVSDWSEAEQEIAAKNTYDLEI